MEKFNLVERLKETLKVVKHAAGTDFSGLGIVVCNSSALLPVFPLREHNMLPVDNDLVAYFSEISLIQNDLHDGFHIISTEWIILRVSQYFSPPIISNPEINRARKFGGRYLAALFGSALPGVSITGIASNGFGVAIFQNGKEIYFEKTI